VPVDKTRDVILLNGEKVSIADFSPTPLAVAMHLGRMPRFAGAINRWWSVLHHTVLCFDYCNIKGSGSYSEDSLDILIKAELLLHDAVESVIGDTADPFKLEEVRDLEDELTKHLFASWFGTDVVEVLESDEWSDTMFKVDRYVNEIDLEVRRAEAWTVTTMDSKDPTFIGHFGSSFNDKEITDRIEYMSKRDSICYEDPYVTPLISWYEGIVSDTIQHVRSVCVKKG